MTSHVTVQPPVSLLFFFPTSLERPKSHWALIKSCGESGAKQTSIREKLYRLFSRRSDSSQMELYLMPHIFGHLSHRCVCLRFGTATLPPLYCPPSGQLHNEGGSVQLWELMLQTQQRRKYEEIQRSLLEPGTSKSWCWMVEGSSRASVDAGSSEALTWETTSLLLAMFVKQPDVVIDVSPKEMLVNNDDKTMLLVNKLGPHFKCTIWLMLGSHKGRERCFQKVQCVVHCKYVRMIGPDFPNTFMGDVTTKRLR